MESISLINSPTDPLHSPKPVQKRTSLVEYHHEQNILIIRDTENLSAHNLSPVLDIVTHHLRNKEKMNCFLYLKKIPADIEVLLSRIFEIFQGYDIKGRKILVSWFTKPTNFEWIQNDFSGPYGLNINLHQY